MFRRRWQTSPIAGRVVQSTPATRLGSRMPGQPGASSSLQVVEWTSLVKGSGGGVASARHQFAAGLSAAPMFRGLKSRRISAVPSTIVAVRCARVAFDLLCFSTSGLLFAFVTNLFHRLGRAPTSLTLLRIILLPFLPTLTDAAVNGGWTDFSITDQGSWSSWTPGECGVAQSRTRTRVASR